ncbi:MAG: aerolysin family beta-barrel pore-forming toxin [Parvularculales bacterium]
MAVDFYSGIWKKGEKQTFGLGTHHNVPFGSMYVGEGFKVSLYDTVEESEDEPTFVYYCNDYHDMSFYRKGPKPKRVKIEETELLRKQMAIGHFWQDWGGAEDFHGQVPLTTEHAVLNMWTGSGTGGQDWLDDLFDMIEVPEGLSIKCFIDHFDISNPNSLKTTPGLVISGPKEVKFWEDPFRRYQEAISIIAIGGVDYKLLSMEVDESTADWEAYTTLGGKVRADNSTPLDGASVGVEIEYSESYSQSDEWGASIGIEQESKIAFGGEASFVKTEFGVKLSVEASWTGATGEEKSQATSVSANAVLDPFTACDCEVIVEMKKGTVDVIRRFINMETNAEVQQKGTITFDQYADATVRFSNYIELNTPEAQAWRAEQAKKEAAANSPDVVAEVAAAEAAAEANAARKEAALAKSRGQ